MSLPFLLSKPSGLVVNGLFRGLSRRAATNRFGIAIQKSWTAVPTPAVSWTSRGYASSSTIEVPVESTGIRAANGPPSLRYFLTNESLSQTPGSSSSSSSATTILHRVRLQERSQSTSSTSPASPSTTPSKVASTKPPIDTRTALRRTFKHYLTLSKPHLTFLVVLTSMASYSLYPTPILLSPTSSTLSAITLLFLTIGTTLCSASANTLNMLAEPHLDAQMTRTRNRPLVRGVIPPRNALFFAVATGVTGVCLLLYGTNPTVAALGLGNIILYAGIYTPLKQKHVINTWVGGLVGGIPPLMGWAAAAGESSTSDSPGEVLSHPGGWLMAALLFAWQFPHFNSLSHGIRDEYKRAGYKMLASVNPAMNARVAVRYAIMFFPICAALSWYGVTDWGFVATSGVVNGWLVWESWRFWRAVGERGTAKRLFWASVWHLPAVLVLAMAHKKGLWWGVYERLMGRSGGEDVEEDEGEGFDYYVPGQEGRREGDYGEGEGVGVVAGTAR